MAKNRRGQALIEFVLLLPVIVMILFVIIDFSFIFYNKNHLEGVLNQIVEYNEKGKTLEQIKEVYAGENIGISYNDSNDIRKIVINKNINLITPFSGTIFSNPYKLTAERTVFNE